MIDENRDNAANFEANNGFSGVIRLKRAFVKGWNTLVLPFSMTGEEVENAFGKDAKVARFTNSTDNVIDLKTDADKYITANVPVLIHLENDIANVAFTADDVTNTASPSTSGDMGIDFVGSYAALTTIPAGQYFINANKLWKSAGASTINSTFAYFTVPASAAGAKIRLFIDGEEVTTTGINGVTTGDTKSADGNVYNLNGQKVGTNLSDLPKGVYIVGGKKVIKK